MSFAGLTGESPSSKKASSEDGNYFFLLPSSN